ncbi:hypothetical protein G6O69_06780 [Pseudenhygromyxa sp. WMMC2535]|uniref:hypothetical protein n=1 Tax=Pseudenhygromyxa sp. WMMC2535 TaxID=2712867 RepID=UPI001556B5A1|nr:hypothetical protein [Pseudenhygromyxa sp. WMMC2535]NVB37531.1 hypothetical protein [Pseudenhygromyxa sp. WMMC2535]
MSRLSLALPLALALLGCKTDPADAEPLADGRQALLEALAADPEACFQDELAYCVEDQAALEAVVDECVAKGSPKTRGELRTAARRCQYDYREAQLDAAHWPAIEARLRARYAAPTLETKDAALLADFGVAPGTIGQVRATRTGGTVGVTEPDPAIVDGDDWLAAGQQLAALAAAHPDAKILQAELEVLDGQQALTLRYELDRERDRVFFRKQESRAITYTTKALGGLDGLASGAVSLREKDLDQCIPEGQDDPTLPAQNPCEGALAKLVF